MTTQHSRKAARQDAKDPAEFKRDPEAQRMVDAFLDADAKSVSAQSTQRPVEVFERTPVFTARNAGHALVQIGDWFNQPPQEGEAVSKIFEFVVDSHRFTVSIDPVD